MGHFPTFSNWTFKRLLVASEGRWRSFWELDSDHLSRVSRGNDLGQFCGYTPLKAKIAKSRPSLEGDGNLEKLSCRTSWQISARSPRSVSVCSNRSNQHRISGLVRWRFWPDLNFGHFGLEQPSLVRPEKTGPGPLGSLSHIFKLDLQTPYRGFRRLLEVILGTRP